MPETRRIGRYTLLREIARGGMARVHLARFVAPGGFASLVAVKQALPGAREEAELRAMLVDEARLASRAVHANIVKTIDVLVEADELFIVMEYVQGESLASLLRACSARGERMPVAVAAAIVTDVLRGLQAAHDATDESGASLGLVHRDLTPQNILVEVSGIAKVCDFGIARAKGRLQVTKEGVVKGKLGYLAPEQVHGEASPLSDLFAAGVVLWEALTTERLFRGEGRGNVLANVLGQRIEPPSTKNPEIPRALDDVVLRALERRPERRFSSAVAMARALEESVTIATRHEVAACVARLGGDALADRERLIRELEQAAAAEDETVTQPPVRRHEPRATSTGKRASLALALGASALVGATVLSLAVVLRKSPPGVAAAPSSASAPEPPPSLLPAASIDTGVDALPSVPGRTGAGSVRPRPSARPGCSPPFTVDATGRKVYNRACF